MKFHTSHVWTDADDMEHEAEVCVSYSYYAGYCGSMEQPPEDASVEVQSVIVKMGDMPDDVLETFVDSEELRQECMEDYAAMLADAAECRAEMRGDYDG